jgi:hypothetical protein
MADVGGGGDGAKIDNNDADEPIQPSATSAVQQFTYYSTVHHQDRQLTIVRREADWTPSLSDINWTDKYVGDLELLREQILSSAVSLPASGVFIWSRTGDPSSPDAETGHYYMVEDREAKASVVLSGWLTKSPAAKTGVAAAAMSGLRRFMDHFKRSKDRFFVMSKATTACPATLTYFKDEVMDDLKGSFVLDHSWHVGDVPNEVLTFTLFNGDVGVNLVAKKIREKKAWLQVLSSALHVARQSYAHRLYKQSRFALVFQLSTRVSDQSSPRGELSRQLRATLQRNQRNLNTHDLVARAMVCANCQGPFVRRRQTLWGPKNNVSRHFCVFCSVVMCSACSYAAPDIAQFGDDDDDDGGGDGQAGMVGALVDEVNQICRDCNFLWNVLPREELQAVLDVERESEQLAIRKHQEQKRIEQAMQEQLELQSRSNAAYEQALSAMQRATEEQMEMLDDSDIDQRQRAADRLDTKEQQELDISTIMEREMSMYPDDLKELFASFDVSGNNTTTSTSASASSSATSTAKHTPAPTPAKRVDPPRTPASAPGTGADKGGARLRHAAQDDDSDNDDGGGVIAAAAAAASAVAAAAAEAAAAADSTSGGASAGTGADTSTPVRRRSDERKGNPPSLALDDVLGSRSSSPGPRHASVVLTPSSSAGAGTALARQRSRSSSRDVLGDMGREIFVSPSPSNAAKQLQHQHQHQHQQQQQQHQEAALASASLSPMLSPQDLVKHLHQVVDAALKQKNVDAANTAATAATAAAAAAATPTGATTTAAAEKTTRHHVVDARVKRDASRERWDREPREPGVESADADDLHPHDTTSDTELVRRQQHRVCAISRPPALGLGLQPLTLFGFSLAPRQLPQLSSYPLARATLCVICVPASICVICVFGCMRRRRVIKRTGALRPE